MNPVTCLDITVILAAAASMPSIGQTKKRFKTPFNFR